MVWLIVGPCVAAVLAAGTSVFIVIKKKAQARTEEPVEQINAE